MMSSSNEEQLFCDRRRQSYRRAEYGLSRIGLDRRRSADRRESNPHYMDASWWLQVNYFDGCYRIKPGTKRSESIFESPDNLQKL
jgi:hypothetical protein